MLTQQAPATIDKQVVEIRLTSFQKTKNPIHAPAKGKTMTAETNKLSPVIYAHTAITYLLKSWNDHNLSYRAKAADANMSLSSFTIEGLMQAGGREEPTRTLTRIAETLSSYLTYDAEDVNKRSASGVEEEAEAQEYLDKVTANMVERYMDWYKPSSSSNAHVEIELYKHEAYRDAVRALKGRSF